ncbi:MAG: sigma-54-dependent Fis family transcriptional regulator [Lentisphaerae bacterium]|nr:sigma-54-dependent Fis family transcriptional regulator [Lentisphaerota bacterium]
MDKHPLYEDMSLVLIDDEPMVLRSLKASLEDLGFSISAFQNPIEGLDWIRDNGADIVVADIFMPECDGFEVLRRLKEIDPDCDLIFITAHGQMDTAIRALREGAADFFEKPFTPVALQAAIERTTRFRILSKQKDLLANQVDLLSGELLSRNNTNVMLGQAPSMKRIAEQIVNVAALPSTVLILGESGTGKELVAHAIHRTSERQDKPFLTLNCASIPEDLFEAEMFGHRRGAFTGAVETRAGYVEASSGGTLFLDEIGDLPMSSQAKILRFLEQRTYLPVGERKERTADVRIIAATNHDLAGLVEEKMFRQDLYYRLNVCTLTCPPLRERKEDVPLLAFYFALQFGAETGKSIEGIDEEAFAFLSDYHYPGNVRELRNIIESSIIHCRHSGMLGHKDLPELVSSANGNADGSSSQPWQDGSLKFEDVERQLYEEALRRTDNNVSGAARILGISRGKLRRRLGAFGLGNGSDSD